MTAGGPGELFEAIRRNARLEQLSIRTLAERHGVHRRTVRQALSAAAPPARKPRVFVAPKLDMAKPLIDAMLREDLTAHRKQQHTSRRVLPGSSTNAASSVAACSSVVRSRQPRTAASANGSPRSDQFGSHQLAGASALTSSRRGRAAG